MAIVQAIIAWIGRSAGSILNAIFGWAVVALFGRTSATQQKLLSALVAGAVLWPLLALGIVAPRATTFLLTFIPVAHSFPNSVIRAIWIALTLVLPMIVGFVVAARPAPGTSPEPVIVRVLRGYPVTLGLACAFVLMFVTIPVLRLSSALRGRADEYLPLITEGDEYPRAADALDRIIASNRLGARRVDPPWWMDLPTRILKKLTGKAMHALIPERFAFWGGQELQIALYPGDLLTRGPKARAAWTHGVIAESLSRGPGLQTSDPVAQDLERQIHRVWGVLDESEAHVGSRILAGRLLEITRDLATLDVPYVEWQIVYRKLGQLGRALEGRRQLLEAAGAKGGSMKAEPVDRPRPFEGVSSGRLVSELFQKTSDLVKKEAELARAELGDYAKATVSMVTGMVVAALFGLVGLGLLATAAVLGLSSGLPSWAAALIVGVVTLVIAGIVAAVAMAKRVKRPLERTQRTLEESIRWARERIA